MAEAVPAVLSVSGQFLNMEAVVTAMDGGSANLFKSTFTPTPQTTHAEFLAQVVTYTGYANLPLDNWLDPLTSSLGGVTTRTPELQWALTTTPATSDTAGGMWIEDGSTPPKVIGYVVFPNPVPFVAVGDGIALTALLNAFGGGLSVNIDDV